MPDFEKSYDYETFFHLTLNTSRLGKFIAHYEAYKMIRSVPGAIVECGVFKGTSFVRFAHFRSLLDNQESSKLIGFDVFSDETPNTEYTVSTAVKSDWCGELSVAIREFDDAGEELGYTVADGEKVSERPNWLSITFTTTPGTTGFSTEVRSGPKAPLWKGFVYYYDNIQAWASR